MHTHKKKNFGSLGFTFSQHGSFVAVTMPWRGSFVRGFAKTQDAAIVRAKSLAGLRLSNVELAILRATD
jgi:hypothetical protein